MIGLAQKKSAGNCDGVRERAKVMKETDGDNTKIAGIAAAHAKTLTDADLDDFARKQCAAATHNLVRELAFDTARAHHKQGITGQRTVTEEAVMQSTLMKARSNEVTAQ